jgi:Uma2 family endonuclease
MDTVVVESWTTDRFLAWEDTQEGKHEFDGHRIIPMTGGSLAHQRIVRNLLFILAPLLDESLMAVVQEMRLRAGGKVRYPDVCVFAGPLDQATRTLNDALAIFEVLSDDTAKTDRVDKVRDYAELASLRCYVLLEQTAVAATVYQRDPGGPWIETPYTDGTIPLPGIGISLTVSDLYRGLTFPA